ncbi:MAG: hypothetical protein LPJ94_05995 [Thauera sp.]|nr:hypothetical protein [Thauera sp.]
MDASSSSPHALSPLPARVLAAGSSASLASVIALVWGGLRDCASALAPVNAVSHWLWRDAALCQQRASLRYSGLGYVIHHSMSVFWAVIYEAALPLPDALPNASRPGAGRVIATGLGMAALACFVDLRLTPERLTPGFERRLAAGPLAAVYVLFGIGLALPRLLALRHGPRHDAC